MATGVICSAHPALWTISAFTTSLLFELSPVPNAMAGADVVRLVDVRIQIAVRARRIGTGFP